MRVKRFSLRALTPQPATVSILLLHGSGTDWLTRQSLQFTRFPFFIRAQELCESRGGRPGLTVPNSPYSLCGRKAILKNRAPELCESRGGRPGLTVPNAPYGLCGLKATLNLNFQQPLRCDSLSPLRFLSGTGRNTNGFSAMLNTVVKTSSLSSWFHLALINPDWAQSTN